MLRRFSVCLVLATLVTLVLVSGSRSASANGRFPQAQAIESVPESDGSTIFLRSTFGILVSRDAGKSWSWICERALGYEGMWDPPIAVTRDGRLWVGLENGLVSTVDGCTVETATELAGETVKDLTTDPKGETLWVLTGPLGRAGAIWRTKIASKPTKIERVGSMPENINPMTIEVAPSSSSRVYVTGQPYGTLRGWLWRSDDGGKTIHGENNDLKHTGPFFIAAVDPKDPNRVVLRHLHTTGSTVLVTTDGKTFTETLSMDSAMFGFAKSANGQTYWAGSGLPGDGIFRSTDRGAHFERVSNHGVLCLHAAPAGRLFVCENPFTLNAPGIALSTDEGKTVTPIASFTDIPGAVICNGDGGASDAGGSICAASWQDVRAQFFPPDAGAPRPRRDGGAGDGGIDGGVDSTSPHRSTCGCKVIGASSGGPDHGWLTTGLLPLAMWGRARRRRGSRRLQRGPSGPRQGENCAS